MRGAVETKKSKLYDMLRQNTNAKFWLEGTIVKEPHQISYDQVIQRIEASTQVLGKVPTVKFIHGCNYIIFDVNKWVRIER